MNGYSNNGFTQSLNGILSLTDGLGTTIENGTITTGDITGDDITGDTITGSTFRGTTVELAGDLTVDNNLTVDGFINFNNVTEPSSLFSTASSTLNGGLIVKKNIYAADVMTNNVVTGNIGCGNLNSSNNITCVDIKTNTIKCNSLITTDIFYKNKISCNINIGVSPYLSIPLTTSIFNTASDITNFNLQTYLINSNNNSLFIQPYYSIIFYNNENILKLIDNSTGSNMLYGLILFNQNLTCTKIIIQYKNKNILYIIMSITSSNNLAVNNSLTVNGNSIFGVDNTSTLICNSKPTFNSDVTTSGNIAQSSGTFSTGSGNINLNDDVVINGTKKLTTGTGDTTINGLLKCNGNINNVGLLTSSGSFELGPTTGTNFTYIDVKTTGGHSDYDARIGVTGGSSSSFGQGALSFNCASCAIAAPLTVNGITNNNTLTQTGTIACNAINCTSINNSGTFNGITCTSINNSGTYNTINSTSINNSGTLTQTGTITCNAINCSGINNGGTLTQTGTTTCNAINCSSISNSGTLTQNGTVSCNAINSSTINNSGTLTQTGAATLSSLSASSINNSGTLTQTGVATFSTNITAPSISTSAIFYAGQAGNTFDTTAITAPKITNGIASGTADGATYTVFNLAINSWNGVGFVYSNPGAPSVCKLVVDNRSGNLSTLGTITCNTLNTTNYNAGTTYNTGSIYMTNASPIYLKSNTDTNHYVKYDSVYDGPQIGVFTGTSIKCTDNNAIIMNASKTAMNIGVSTSITGNCTISNKCTIQNGMVINGLINESKYFTLKGYSNNNSTSTTFYLYKKFDGSMGNSASETFQMPLGCLSTKITYSYDSTYSSNVFQGAREYIIYGKDYSGIDTVWTAGSTNYPPVITCTSYGLITIEFPKNTALSGNVNWSFSILMM